MRAAHGVFKKSPVRWADYLSANGIEERYDDSTFFPLKFCGHRWLENGKAISDKLVIFLVKSKERKTFLLKMRDTTSSSEYKVKDFPCLM